MTKLRILQIFPKFNYLGYHTPGDVATFEDNNAKELVIGGFAELFEDQEVPVKGKEEKLKKSTKEDKAMLQIKEVKFEDYKGEE